MKLTVVIPVFNEKATIAEAINRAKRLKIDKEIIVIDNYSTDGTGEILKNLKDDSIKIIFHPRNLGPGGSVQTALKLAKGDYIYFHHSDLEYNADDVYNMVQKMEKEKLDAVFGSRLADKMHLSKLTLLKERPYVAATLLATYLINKWYKRKFTDVIATKLVKTDVYRSLNCKFRNQGSEFELAGKLSKRGYRIGETPIYYKPRSHKEGKKIKMKDMIPALIALFKVRFFDRYESR